MSVQPLRPEPPHSRKGESPDKPKSLFSSWTKKYSLSKTLRFELKPTPETKKFLEKGNFIELDCQRAEDYKKLKKIIDEYHKRHIQKTLSEKGILSVPDLKKLSDLIKKSKNLQEDQKQKEIKKSIKELQTRLRKQIKKHFATTQAKLDPTKKTSKEEKEKKPNKNSPLFGKELITKILPDGLSKISWKDVKENEELFLLQREDWKNEKDFLKWKEESQGIIKKFDKFTVYLTGFHKNRENMYSDKAQGTAISHRIIHENLPRFLSNRETYNKIQEKHPDLIKSFEVIKPHLKEEFDHLKIKNIKELFEIDFFNQCLSQKGIDSYNVIVGGKKKEGQGEKPQGINEKINLYRQQKKSSSKNQDIKIKFNNKNLPFMQTLHKQILSERQSHSFYDREEFKNRKEVLSKIDEFYKILSKKDESKKQNILQGLKALFTEKLPDSSWDEIYFKSSELNRLSHKCFEDYSLIPSSLRYYVEKHKEQPTFSTKSKRETWLKKDFFSFEEVHKALLSYSEESEELRETLFAFSKHLSAGLQKASAHKARHTRESGYPENSNHLNKWENILLSYFHSEFNDKNYNEGIEDRLSYIKNLYQKVEKIPHSPSNPFNEDEKKVIHEFLKSLMELFHLIKPVYLDKAEDLDRDTTFYAEFETLYEKLTGILPLFDKTRNYITKNKKHLEKIKINFENSNLLGGWDVNKESGYLSVILRKKENGRWLYYLGIMDPENKNIFDYHLNFNDHYKEKTKQKKQTLRGQLLAKPNEEHYEKMNYKLLPDPSKMLPKVFFSKKNISFFQPPEEIKRINNNKTYTKNTGANFILKDCHKIIDFFKQSIEKHYDWKQFGFKFSETSQYKDISDFYYEVNSQGYKLSFDKIKISYIEEKLKTGELYLFQIYNKDFSQNKKREGKDNLHTNYFKMLFEEENLKDTVFKLNGQAEVFYRKASKKRHITHLKNKPIKNKNSLNPKTESEFSYDIIKDKRFTEDKFLFHVPITFNFKEEGMNPGHFNQKALGFLKGSKNINVIGIDRGERHLAYYALLNQKGDILKQGSFNQITTSYKNKAGQRIEVETPYHNLLEKREKERDLARKDWGKIESIKELKSGLLSHLVHQIARLMIKHNAIVVFEDLNKGFKRGRMKFEKQVYQKLEKALIDKLNHLVFKDTQNQKKAGGFLNAFQLTAPFESFSKMGRQTGFIFYTTAHYTSKACPCTGFVNLIYPHYENINKSQAFFKNFDKIYFDNSAGHFVFEYQDGKVNPQRKSESKASWKVCSHGEERYKYDYKNKTHIKVNVTEKLKALFNKYNIPYQEEQDLIKSICAQKEKDFWWHFIDFLKLILQLRYVNPKAKEESKRDYILSPVAGKKGRFFDSRKAKDDNKPKNADANGAYHIGLKGLMILDKINKWDLSKEKYPNLKITNKEWFEFIRCKTLSAQPKKAC